MYNIIVKNVFNTETFLSWSSFCLFLSVRNRGSKEFLKFKVELRAFGQVTSSEQDEISFVIKEVINV
ncbi:hypothetical protein Avbf_16667 [Armadillidium vulgare]|nr:hypothetical protein Avbf_16667 [Armadillidium vulgare]